MLFRFVLAILASQLGKQLLRQKDRAATKGESHGRGNGLRLLRVSVAHRRVFSGPVNDLGGLGHSCPFLFTDSLSWISATNAAARAVFHAFGTEFLANVAIHRNLHPTL